MRYLLAAVLLAVSPPPAWAQFDYGMRDSEAPTSEAPAEVERAADGTPMKQPDGTPNPAFFNPKPSYRSPEGFQKARWGMTKAEVRKLYPGLKSLKGGLAMETEVAGRRAVTSFIFTKGKLAGASVVFLKRYETGTHAITDFESVKAVLAKKYGEPVSDDQNWREGLFEDDPEHLSTALVLGHVELRTTWKTTETAIAVDCEAEKMTARVRISYLSARLLQSLQQDWQDAEAADL